VKPGELARPAWQAVVRVKPGELVVGEDMVSGRDVIRPVQAADGDPDALRHALQIWGVLIGELATAAPAKPPHGNVRRLEISRLALGEGEVLRREPGPGEKRPAARLAAHAAIAIGDRLGAAKEATVAHRAAQAAAFMNSRFRHYLNPPQALGDSAPGRSAPGPSLSGGGKVTRPWPPRHVAALSAEIWILNVTNDIFDMQAREDRQS